MSPPRQLRVIVGEDQAFVREGIVHVLTDGGFERRRNYGRRV